MCMWFLAVFRLSSALCRYLGRQPANESAGFMSVPKVFTYLSVSEIYKWLSCSSKWIPCAESFICLSFLFLTEYNDMHLFHFHFISQPTVVVNTSLKCLILSCNCSMYLQVFPAVTVFQKNIALLWMLIDKKTLPDIFRMPVNTILHLNFIFYCFNSNNIKDKITLHILWKKSHLTKTSIWVELYLFIDVHLLFSYYMSGTIIYTVI